MKTIGYYDKGQGRGGVIRCYSKEGQTRHERTAEALKEIQHMGNVVVYLIKGRKTRKLFERSM